MTEGKVTNPRRNLKRIPLFENEPQNLAEVFTFAAQKSPRLDALNFKENDQWVPISSEEMLSRIENVALGLYSEGIRTGDRAAILAPNSPDWTIADAGCQFAGVIDVPIYTTLTPDSIKYILNDSKAKAIFLYDKKTYDSLRGILSECGSIEKLILFDPEGVGAENSMSLRELEELGRNFRSENPELISELINGIKPDDTATLIYTSGTTGEPKGVMLSHENLLSNVIDAGEHFHFTTEDVPLSVLPLSHVFERTGMYLYIYNGMAVHFAESIEKISDNLREIRPTIFVGVPRIFEKVYATAKLRAANSSKFRERIFDWAIDIAKEFALKNERKENISAVLGIKHSVADKIVFSKLRAFFGGRLRFCISGGAALSNSIYLIFTGADISIMQGYGLTETSPVISSNNPLNHRLGTVGKPIRNVEVRIAEDGEIEVTGPNVMRGYYNKPEATKESFSEDGWFKTGDIGELDKDGFLKITDRKKELFKTSGGKYIAPSPIEQMIKGSRFVNQVVLIGNSRKFASALIVPNFDQLENYIAREEIPVKTRDEICSNSEIIELFEKEVEKYCEGLARFETVKKVALLSEELTVATGELTPTLKIKRRVIDEKYKELIDSIYENAEMKKPVN
ncbi:MAG: long-chain fatty acid--CoA ligase [Pyrinomonadaceae bacterium]